MNAPASAAAPRTFLLLGGGGFIGTNLAARLERGGHRVLLTGHGTRGASNGRWVDLPLTDTDGIMALIADHAIDTVVQLASSMLPSSTEAHYQAEQDAIIAPTRRLAARLADRGVRLVFFSSGGTVYGATSRDYATEDDPCAPIGYYGQAKLETELHLQFLARTRGLRLLTLRPSNPYGMHQSLTGAQGLVSVILGKLRDGGALEVWGDGTVVRDYIYIDDCVESVAALLVNDVAGTTLNIGSGVGHSLLEVVATVEEALGARVPLLFRPARPVDVPRLVLDVERLKGMGMYHHRPLLDGVRDYAQRLGMRW